MAYRGPERRVHTCFITQNREYHTRRGVCVAVRDRATAAWMAGHRAVGLALTVPERSAPFLGRPLELAGAGARVLTSRVVDICRPGRTVVDAYALVAGFSPYVETA